MRLADEDPENELKLVPGSQGMDVPSACSIVIIAGSSLTHRHNFFKESLQVGISAKWTW